MAVLMVLAGLKASYVDRNSLLPFATSLPQKAVGQESSTYFKCLSISTPAYHS